jgi:hypothetical protein
MDPHFNEYLAAIDGMHELYGETPDDTPTEFHEVSSLVDVVIVTKADSAPRAGCAHWDCEPSEEFAGSGIWTI